MQANEAGRRRSSPPPPTTRRPTPLAKKRSRKHGRFHRRQSRHQRRAANFPRPETIPPRMTPRDAVRGPPRLLPSGGPQPRSCAQRAQPPIPSLRGRGARRGNGRKAAPLSDSRRLPATPAAAARPAAATARPVSEAAHTTPHHRHAERSTRPVSEADQTLNPQPP